MAVNRCRMLLVIDNAPLQAAVWAELQRARQRLEKATSDLHRHEDVDEPAFHAWLGRAFPEIVNATRELAMKVEAKRRLVEEVVNEAFFTNRSESAVWREWQRHGGSRPPAEASAGSAAHAGDREEAWGAHGFADDEEEDEGEDFMRFFNGEMDAEEYMRSRRGTFADKFGFSDPEFAAQNDEARAIYRRLVQQLHPDRGGEWTPARAKLWEQVQQAWSDKDADWLARLEVEWEAATDQLGPTSPLGRLRAGLVEIEAARRDAERKLRFYRKAHAWRFSLQASLTVLRVKMERLLKGELEMLREQLEDLEGVVTNWEREARRRARGGRAERKTSIGQGELW